MAASTGALVEWEYTAVYYGPFSCRGVAVHSIRRLLSSAVIAAAVAASPLAVADSVTVFAAASVKEAMDEQAQAFQRGTGNKVIVSYGASNALAKQIEAAAPADLFISADRDWMDFLDSRRLLAPGTQVDLLRNTLVLIAPSSSTLTLAIGPRFGLAAALGTEKLAMANPDSVPAGKYGRRALDNLGVWTSVERNVARAENVRAALALVSRGEAALGIVYRTDALADKGVRIVAAFPSDSHPPIVYPAAVLAASTSSSARALLEFLRAEPARAVWRKYGFVPAQ